MTGMRSGEMFALTWEDIDFVTGMISITKQWTSKDGITEPKNREHRRVPISSDLRNFLLELRSLPPVEGNHVLPRLTEWERGEQAKVLKVFCKVIGITEIKFHDLRATFITNLLSQGVPLAQVMSIVGHRHTDTTDIYLRLAGVNIRGATEALAYKIPTAGDISNVVAIR